MTITSIAFRARGDQPPAEPVSYAGSPAVRGLPHLQIVAVMPEQAESRPTQVLLGTLSALGFRVVRAIPVELETEDGTVIASWQEIDEFGTGASMSAACEELGRTVAELYISLEAERETLGPDLQRVWKVIIEHVVQRK